VTPISSTVSPKTPTAPGSGEMEKRIDALDWSRTSIGPPENWSQALKTTIRILVANRFPMLLWWGPAYTSIYNDAYIPILGKKHPWALGRPVRECWSEIWEILKPLIDTPFQGGPATWSEDIELHINRTGFTEETHFTVAYSRVPDETAPRGIGGVLATVNEITGKIIGQRRATVLRELASAVEAKTAKEASVNAIAKFSAHTKDIPFALIYLCDADGSAASVAATGIENAPMLAPALIKVDDQSAVWPFSGQMQTVNLEPKCGAIPNGPWPDPPRQAVVLPIRSHMANQFAGFLVAGLSSRLSFDESYADFLNLVTSQIATAISTARAYEEERKRAERLAEIDRAKTVFFSNVSHEFRTPLTLMLGPLESVMANGDIQQEAREQLATAHRNSLRLLKLVNSLLDFSRIEAGRAKASYEPLDLAAITTDIASNFRSIMEAAGLEFVVDCAPLPQPVYVDREMWEKIVLNLLSNAFKFTFEGRVTLRLTASEGKVLLTVADTGVGIPASELPHIFERFHRVEGVRGRTYEGSGIGLALIQELAKLHGGTVNVESNPGMGSLFSVTLPFGRAHLPKEQIGAATGQSSTVVRSQAFTGEALTWIPPERLTHPSEEIAAPRTSQPVRSRPRVLFPDDNADMRAHVTQIPGPRFDLVVVPDGCAALEEVRRTKPDLILSDVMMPHLDGLGLLGELRADPHLREVLVILISARAGEEARTEGITAGADDYVTKPLSAKELVARVETMLELQRVRREAREAVDNLNADLRRELAAMAHMQQLSVRLIQAGELNTLLDEILKATIEVTQADKGNIQLFQEGVLRIALQRGFEAPFLNFFNTVDHGSAACRTALQQQARVVVDDVSASSIFEGAAALDVPLAAGVHAVQSTPLVSRSGRMLGMLSTHYAVPKRPSERDLRLLDILARQAADLIERTRAEEALRESEEQLRRTIEDAPIPIIVQAEDGEVLQVSNAWTTLTGYTLEDASVIQTWLTRAYGFWGDEVRGAVQHIFQNNGIPVGPTEFDIVTRGGDVRHWLFSGSVPGYLRDGRRFVVGMAQDITERKRAEEQRAELLAKDRALQSEKALRQKEAELARVVRALSVGELATSIAHEINQPLAGVVTNAQAGLRWLSSDPPNLEEAKESFSLVARDGTRAAAVIKRIREFLGKGNAETALLNLNEIVQDAAILARSELEMRQISLRTELSSELPRIPGDRIQLQQVILNLILNSAEAMDSIEGSKELVFRSHMSAAGGAVVAVRDSGNGISPPDLERMFEPLFTTKPTGLGMGLSISRSIIEAHGGRIWAELNQGPGLTVQFELPAEDATPGVRG
jgi:PAS domain S-box-containing protein